MITSGSGGSEGCSHAAAKQLHVMRALTIPVFVSRTTSPLYNNPAVRIQSFTNNTLAGCARHTDHRRTTAAAATHLAPPGDSSCDPHFQSGPRSTESPTLRTGNTAACFKLFKRSIVVSKSEMVSSWRRRGAVSGSAANAPSDWGVHTHNLPAVPHCWKGHGPAAAQNSNHASANLGCSIQTIIT